MRVLTICPVFSDPVTFMLNGPFSWSNTLPTIIVGRVLLINFDKYPPCTVLPQSCMHVSLEYPQKYVLKTCRCTIICDQIWENPLYGIRTRFAFLVAQVEICRSPDFVIHISNNPSSNCCCRSQRLYKRRNKPSF